MRLSLAAIPFFAFCSSAFAQVIDLSNTTCQTFDSSSKEEVGIILHWLDGYYKRENDLPVIDMARFVTNATKLREYCANHPTAPLFTATANLLEK